MSACVVPDVLRGVRMHHSDDLVTIYHGTPEPITACGFHARYSLPEVYEEARNPDRCASTIRCSCAHNTDGTVTTLLCPIHADTDPCLTTARVTGRRRKGTIRRGACSACGHRSES